MILISFPLRVSLFVVLGFSLFLLVAQTDFIFKAHPYQFSVYADSDLTSFEQIQYEVEGLKQTAFLVRPRSGQAEDYWIMFHGNAALALDWMELVAEYPDEDTGFLLIDYPGYGKNEGRPSFPLIIRSASEALLAWEDIIRSETVGTLPKVRFLGYSIGAAVGLRFANLVGLEEGILVAPFSSLQELACRRVLKPFCWLLYHRADNLKQAELFFSENPNRKLTIISGEKDTLCPPEMSLRLSKVSPDKTKIVVLENTNHFDALTLQQEIILREMLELSGLSLSEAG